MRMNVSGDSGKSRRQPALDGGRVQSGLEEDNGLESPRLKTKNPRHFTKIYTRSRARGPVDIWSLYFSTISAAERNILAQTDITRNAES